MRRRLLLVVLTLASLAFGTGVAQAISLGGASASAPTSVDTAEENSAWLCGGVDNALGVCVDNPFENPYKIWLVTLQSGKNG